MSRQRALTASDPSPLLPRPSRAWSPSACPRCGSTWAPSSRSRSISWPCAGSSPSSYTRPRWRRRGPCGTSSSKTASSPSIGALRPWPLPSSKRAPHPIHWSNPQSVPRSHGGALGAAAGPLRRADARAGRGEGGARRGAERAPDRGHEQVGPLPAPVITLAGLTRGPWSLPRRQHESLSHMSFVKELSRLTETDSNVHRLLARMSELGSVWQSAESMRPPQCASHPSPLPLPLSAQVVTETTVDERRNARRRGASTRQRSLGARIAAALEDEGTACACPVRRWRAALRTCAHAPPPPVSRQAR